MKGCNLRRFTSRVLWVERRALASNPDGTNFPGGSPEVGPRNETFSFPLHQPHSRVSSQCHCRRLRPSPLPSSLQSSTKYFGLRWPSCGSPLSHVHPQQPNPGVHVVQVNFALDLQMLVETKAVNSTTLSSPSSTPAHRSWFAILLVLPAIWSLAWEAVRSPMWMISVHSGFV